MPLSGLLPLRDMGGWILLLILEQFPFFFLLFLLLQSEFSQLF